MKKFINLLISLRKHLNIIFMFIASLVAPSVAQSAVLEFLSFQTTTQSVYSALESTPAGDYIYAVKGSSPETVESYFVRDDGTLESKLAAVSLAGILGAQSFRFSSDGRFALVGNDDSGGTRHGLFAYFRGSEGGLEVSQFVLGANAPVAGVLDGMNIKDALFSRDQKTIYAVGTQDNGGTPEGVIVALTGVQLDPTLKQVKYAGQTVIAQVTGANPVATLISPIKLAVSRTSATKDVYVISDAATADDDAFLHFTRNESTGELTFNTAIHNKMSGISDVDGLSDIHVTTNASSQNTIYVAAAGSDSIIQLAQTSSTPAISEKYKNGSDQFAGLEDVSKLLFTGNTGLVYAASPVDKSITPFVLTNEGLEVIPDAGDIKDGVGSITGIEKVDLMVLGRFGRYVYAGTTDDDVKKGLATFSRVSELELTVTALNRRSIQPGQIAEFGVEVVNVGIADAPDFSLILNSNTTLNGSGVADTRVNGSDARSCTAEVAGGSPVITCELAQLKKDQRFSIIVSVLPRSVTTATLLGRALSRNAAPRIASDSAEVKVGEFKNGSLSMGYIMLLILSIGILIRVRSHNNRR